MRRITSLSLSLIILTACNQEQTPLPGGPDTGLALARSSHAKDSLILLKDSLLGVKEKQLSLQSQLIGDAATSARLVSEINRDLSKARDLRIKPDTSRDESQIQNASEELAIVQKKVQAVIARLNSAESRIRRLRSDSITTAAFGAEQMARIGEYEKSIANLRSTVDQQRMEIAVLTQRVDSVVAVTRVLYAKNDSVVARNEAMAAHEDSVFVAIGTEKELTAKGIIRREGGTRLMFGRGKTIVPARTLDPAAFTVMSKARDLTIPLPRTDKDYRVVSRQSLDYAQIDKPKDALVRGSLKVTDPGKFWAPSKYLILVQR